MNSDFAQRSSGGAARKRAAIGVKLSRRCLDRLVSRSGRGSNTKYHEFIRLFAEKQPNKIQT